MNSKSDFQNTNLQRIRKARGITQEDLADRTGMSKGAIRAFEQRVNWPAPERIELLCKALDTTPLGFCRESPRGQNKKRPHSRKRMRPIFHFAPARLRGSHPRPSHRLESEPVCTGD